MYVYFVVMPNSISNMCICKKCHDSKRFNKSTLQKVQTTQLITYHYLHHKTGYLTVYGVGSPGLDPSDGVDDADLAFDLDLRQETRHRTEQTATATTVPKMN